MRLFWPYAISICSVNKKLLCYVTSYIKSTNLNTLFCLLFQKELSAISCPIVIVVSTTGDGEPPENTDIFWRKIRKKSNRPDTLKNLTYAILGESSE